MSALPHPVAEPPRRLHLVNDRVPAPPPGWRFVLRGALTSLVLGAVAVAAVVITARAS